MEKCIHYHKVYQNLHRFLYENFRKPRWTWMGQKYWNTGFYEKQWKQKFGLFHIPKFEDVHANYMNALTCKKAHYVLSGRQWFAFHIYFRIFKCSILYSWQVWDVSEYTCSDFNTKRHNFEIVRWNLPIDSQHSENSCGKQSWALEREIRRGPGWKKNMEKRDNDIIANRNLSSGIIHFKKSRFDPQPYFHASMSHWF